MSIVERDRARIREQMIRFEEENRAMMGQIEEQKIEMAECKKHIEIYEEKIA